MTDSAVLDPSAMLRSAGLRVTQPRLAVLDALARHPHAATDVIIAAAREARPVSHQAVYDVLHTFADLGLVRRIQPAGSVARYELRVGDNHHHVVCRSCGDVVDIDCATGSAPCLDPSELDVQVPGFVLHEAEVTYWGLCAACAGAAEPQSDLTEPHHTAQSRTTEKRKNRV
jgi:Fe2+ or Zn2+ uptake regulation protein